MKLLLSFVALMIAHTTTAQGVEVIERDDLRIHIFRGEPVIFNVASMVLEGRGEVALIDAGFAAENARRLVELIRSIGKPLSTIFISYSDPDYYFGLETIAAAFPDAKILSTPQTRWLIETTKDEKLAIWAPQMGANAPKKIIVPTAINSDHFMLEDHRIEIKRLPGDEQHAWLWIPSVGAILGGVYLDDGEHLWVADSPTPEDRLKWLTALDTMKGQAPAIAIPAHFATTGTKDPITFTQKYLVDLENALSGSETADKVIAAMKGLYPSLGGESNLEMTARVLKGETKWKTARAFPAIGRRVEVNFGGEYDFELTFHDDRTLSFRGLKQRENDRPMTDTLQYTAVEVAPAVWMVYWTESDNTHVVHVEDYGGGVAWTNISAPDGSFTNLKGTLKMLHD